MKSILREVAIILLATTMVLGNGVCIVDAESADYLHLIDSDVTVQVENQVAVVTATQTFRNNSQTAVEFKYAFPLSGEESATGLRWFINQQWHEAVIEPSPQDTTLPGGTGGGINDNLEAYLGETPLYFEIDETLAPDSLVTIELSYVNLLPYRNGNVSFQYPNDYSLIQNGYLDHQQIAFEINSERNIDAIIFLSHTADTTLNEGTHAFIGHSEYETAAATNYIIQYTLNPDELGLFGLSTYLNVDQVPDGGDRGFLVFIAEPDAGNTSEVIDKVFTLIIDKSGSMGYDKMEQAKGAASFIVQNMNEGDRFNIVVFSSTVYSFQPGHVEFNPNIETLALNFISSLYSGGSTNISGAFGEAIPQFSTADEGTANIIVFFTDGEATTGITDTQGILDHVQSLVSLHETELTIFSFGVGAYVNEQLLTLLATENNGLAEFLGDDELEERITEFYLLIRNPVLLNTGMSFSPALVSDAFPAPLPNLYVGQQMIVTGRYSTSAVVDINLTGTAFGQPASYTYPLTLAEEPNPNYQFLPKIWAKKKIENLLVQYYILQPGSAAAETIRNEIVTLSVQFGVITPFTSFTTPTHVDEESLVEAEIPENYQVLKNYPNPFNAGTHIRFRVATELNKPVTVMIYNALGQLVRILTQNVGGPGLYEVFWDGTLSSGELAASGVYVYLIDFGDALMGGKMTLIK